MIVERTERSIQVCITDLDIREKATISEKKALKLLREIGDELEAIVPKLIKHKLLEKGYIIPACLR